VLIICYTLKNFCTKIELKGNKTELIQKAQNRQIEILTEDEINKIKNVIKDTTYELLILLDLCTGLRLGELLALDWNCIDLKAKTLKVERSVKEVYIYDNEDTKHIETIFQVPKTIRSFRTLPIPDDIVKRLKKITNKNGLVFKDNNNNVLKGKNVASEWNRIQKACNIPHKKFHSIRHTYASILLKNGIDIQTVSELMGHYDISVTQIYLHSSKEQKHNAINKINYLFKN